MNDSILNSVKKLLGLDENYSPFDVDVIMHVNGALADLAQIGVGPDTGFSIKDVSETWVDFLGDDPLLNNVITYVYISVRLIFDPPATSYLIEAYEKRKDELTFRINVTVESRKRPLVEKVVAEL